MYSKKAMLKSYQSVDRLADKTNSQTAKESPSLYRSDYDEKLIKEYHYAKFRKNLAHTQTSPELQQLLSKEDWTDEDTKAFLALLR